MLVSVITKTVTGLGLTTNTEVVEVLNLDPFRKHANPRRALRIRTQRIIDSLAQLPGNASNEIQGVSFDFEIKEAVNV